ncbi:unnamed protein product, partial [Didymodactylos carnosus]
QIPVKYLSSNAFKQSSLFTSLKPLSNYIQELSIQTIDLIAKKQAIEILLSFAVAKASFTDLLYLIVRLIFNTDNINIYDVRGLILQLNNGLVSIIDEVNLKKQLATKITNITIANILEKQEQCQLAYVLKQTNDKSEKDLENSSIFTHPFVDNTIYKGTETEIELAKEDTFQRFQSQQLSFFALQSLLSILLVLIKTVQITDSTIIYQILTLTKQFIQQIPARYLSSDTFKQSSLFTSLKPLSNYIQELAVQTEDLTAKKQAIEILLSFAVAKVSFIELLPLITKLVLDRDNINIYDVRGLFLQLNEWTLSTVDEVDLKKQLNEDKEKAHETSINTTYFVTNPLGYLHQMNVLSNTTLMLLDDNKFSGIFVTSVLLAHIDYHNEINSACAFNTGSLTNSFSFSFHADTFKLLFTIIENLSFVQLSDYTAYILIACLRLFTTHLKFLIKSDLNTTEFVTNTELEQWKELMLQLA